jgi:hypothetical protein
MKTLKLKQVVAVTAISLGLGATLAFAADTTAPSTDTTKTQPAMTGKDKATAIGAGSGAVAGAVVGGPVGAVVGAGIGAYVGHEGTDAKGRVSSSSRAGPADDQVKRAQAALNDKGYTVAVDGRNGPNTQTALRSFQEKNGLTASGTLDDATLNALGVKS